MLFKNYKIFESTIKEIIPIVGIPSGEYFALGDNRDHSSDSREWGVVKKEEIVGRAFLRYWPFNKLGIIQKPTY